MPPSNARARQLLAQAGQALHGEQWQSRLSRALGLNRNSNSLRDWLNGKNTRFDLAHPVWPKIESLLRGARTPTTLRLANTIKAEALPSPVQKLYTPSGPKARE